MSRTNRHRRPQRSAKRPLSVERLEDRSLLAVAAFTIELHEDVGGLPGAVLAADEVQTGDSFFVEIRAQEFHPLLHGLHGVALNIAWDPSALEEIDAGFDLSQIVTDDLPLFRGGTLDNAAGTIDNLSGSAFHASGIGRPIGDGVAERFALLHFRAIAACPATAIHLSEGASSIVAMPAATFSSTQLSFEEQAIAVWPADPQVTTEIAEPLSEELPPDELPPDEPLPGEIVTLDPTSDEETPTEWTERELDGGVIYTMTGAPSDAPPAEPATWGCGDEEFAWTYAPPAETGDDLAATDDGSNDLASYGPFNDNAEDTPPLDAAVCLTATDFAAAVDAVLMGPLTPEQCPTARLRLEDIIAAIASEIELRRRRSSAGSIVLDCS